MSGPQISFYDANDLVNGDMAKITDGSLSLFYKIAGERHLGAILTRASAGTAKLGGWTTLDGYFTSTPEVTLSPKKVPTYMTKFHPGVQSVAFSAEIREKAEPGKYEIKPVVTFKMKAVSKSASPAIEYNGIDYDAGASGDDPTDMQWWPANAPFMTGWYPAIGTLTVSFSFTTGYHLDYVYPTTLVAALDIATSYYPAMGAVSKSWSTNAAAKQYMLTGSGSLTYNGPNTMYSWRLRRNLTFGYPEYGTVGGAAVYKDKFSLDSYSFSCSEQSETLSDTGIEVFYLAVGR